MVILTTDFSIIIDSYSVPLLMAIYHHLASSMMLLSGWIILSTPFLNTVNVLKFEHFSNFSNKLLVIRPGIRKMLVRIANGEDPDLDLYCFSSLFGGQLVFTFLEQLPLGLDTRKTVFGGLPTTQVQTSLCIRAV